jgi:hypothetical protein
MNKRTKILLVIVGLVLSVQATIVLYTAGNPRSLHNRQLFYGDYNRKFGGQHAR